MADAEVPGLVRCLAGIFVGGKSSRMHGVPKGLLQPPGEARNLVERLRDELMAAGLQQIVLVGTNSAYVGMRLPSVCDATLGQGPLSGLLGLLDHAANTACESVLAIACDMPAVDRALLRRLLHEYPEAAALVPRRSQFEPLCARYHVGSVRPRLVRLLEQGDYRMMHLLRELGPGCVPLVVEPSSDSTLADWDSPEELPEGVTYHGHPLAADSGRR